jgi:hypothetical protein
VGACGLVAALVLASACSDDDSSGNNNTPPDWTVGTVLNWVDDGVLAEVQTDYGPVKILRVQGPHYDMGFQYGYLLQEQIQTIWDELFVPLIGEELGVPPEFAIDLFCTLMDQAWDHVLPYTPQKFLDELDGVADGALAAGHPDPAALADIVRRIMMLVDTSQAESFGGELGEMTTFFNRGFSERAQEYYAQAAVDLEGFEQTKAMDGVYVPTPFRDALSRLAPVPACSFFAAWGDRTDGRQIATRVLDWSADMGLAAHALITVYVPDGGVANVTVGYVGMLSAFAGMNEVGVALSAVGSGSALDRLKTQSISLRGRDLLETAEDLDGAIAMFSGDISSSEVVAPSVGTVAGMFYGDPAGGGAGAEGAVTEFNAVFASVFRYGPAPGCGESAWLYEFAEDGTTAAEWNHIDHPDVVNLESDACEIDATGMVRTFLVDANQEFVYDATSGLLIDDPAGEPYPVGVVYPCSVYRADPAMAYGVRRWQTAANGPQRDSANKLMHLSGVYRFRHKPQGDMIDAYHNGTRYEYEGTEVIPDNGGQRTLIGVPEAKVIVRVVAMENANVFSVIYDTTNLVLHVAFESGTGDTWTRAVDNEYYEFRLADLIPQR